MTVEGVEDTKEAWIDTASGKYPFTFLLVYLSKKKRGFFCASLLLKMSLGIHFFGFYVPRRFFDFLTRTGSYELVRVQKSKWQVS